MSSHRPAAPVYENVQAKLGWTASCGVVIWLTGLPASGKTTTAQNLRQALEGRVQAFELLDGDAVRRHLSNGLGFSRADRDTNILRIGWVASRLARVGATVVVAAISPYADARKQVRQMVEEHARFVEVYVLASSTECERRDPKGLYAKARAGELSNFTGVSDPYEPPDSPDVTLPTEGVDPAQSATTLLEALEALNIFGKQE